MFSHIKKKKKRLDLAARQNFYSYMCTKYWKLYIEHYNKLLKTFTFISNLENTTDITNLK